MVLPQKMAIRTGTQVWVPCHDNVREAVFAAATIKDGMEDAEGRLLVCDEDAKEVRSVRTRSVRLRNSESGERTCEDSTGLMHMNDATVLHNLHERFKQDKIYTYTATVLLAVNPYSNIAGLYGKDNMEHYRGKTIGQLPPHPYAIADYAYRLLKRERKDQAMLISGESGAGKTETAKIVMSYLAHCSGSSSSVAAAIEKKVLNAQPILESFGNAVTLRNSNSSRFGKYNRVYFTEQGVMAYAKVTTYLLESSRVVVHAEGERTYHVFYEMLAGCSDEQLAALHLDRTQTYQLLHGTRRPLDGFHEHDANNYRQLRESLRTVGQDDVEVDAMLRILAGLILLGNVGVQDEQGNFVLEPSQSDDQEPPVQLNEDIVKKAAQLLGMHHEEISGTLQKRRIRVGGRVSECHEVSRTAPQFRQTLHGLVKAVYKRLFEQLVKRINESFKRDDDSADNGATGTHIGILDIYGFEQLKRNSFEQLCINLANERLQHYFVENVLAAEQDTYKLEHIPWTDLPVPDCTPVVNCISQLFATLDEFSMRLARGTMTAQCTDNKFCEQILGDASKDAQHRNLLRQPGVTDKKNRKFAFDSFTIKHFAGLVEYDAQGWLDKNNDRLEFDCEMLISDSENPAVKALAEEDKNPNPKAGMQFRSISKKYIQDLEALLQTLGNCNMHYIRCFKSNEHKQPGVFNHQLVLDQIVHCGTIELVKIMSYGFPNRCPCKDMEERFRGMLPECFQRFGTQTFVGALMEAYEVPPDQWAVGITKLFLKAGQLQKLEDMKSSGAKPDADKLTQIIKGMVRKRWLRAAYAISICRYLPIVVARKKKEKAELALTKLARHALLISHLLLPRLRAAAQRVAERKLRARRRLGACFKSVAIMQSYFRDIERKRLQRARAQRRLRIRFVLVQWLQASFRDMERKRLQLQKAKVQRRLRIRFVLVKWLQDSFRDIERKRLLKARAKRRLRIRFVLVQWLQASFRDMERKRLQLKKARAQRRLRIRFVLVKWLQDSFRDVERKRLLKARAKRRLRIRFVMVQWLQAARKRAEENQRAIAEQKRIREEEEAQKRAIEEQKRIREEEAAKKRAIEEQKRIREEEAAKKRAIEDQRRIREEEEAQKRAAQAAEELRKQQAKEEEEMRQKEEARLQAERQTQQTMQQPNNYAVGAPWNGSAHSRAPPSSEREGQVQRPPPGLEREDSDLKATKDQLRQKEIEIVEAMRRLHAKNAEIESQEKQKEQAVINSRTFAGAWALSQKSPVNYSLVWGNGKAERTEVGHDPLNPVDQRRWWADHRKMLLQELFPCGLAGPHRLG